MATLGRPDPVVVVVALSMFLFLASGAGSAQTCPSPDQDPSSSPTPNSSMPPAADVITLKAVGDIVLGSDWPQDHYPPGFEERVIAQIKPLLDAADVVFGNFEGALTTHKVSTKTPRSGAVFAFRMPPRFARLFRRAGFNALHIANNHTFDFGETGFADTLAHLAEAGILTVGERHKITLQKAKGLTLAWVGFSYSARHNDMRDTAALTALIQAARKQADLVVISIQAGAEGNEALKVVARDELFLGENRGNVFAFSRQAIDLGADLVLGHGPHVVRGMECYQGKLIAYSLGNFMGYGALSIKRAAAISVVLEVKLTKDRRLIAFDVLPVKFNDDRLPERDENRFARYLINDLSRLPPLNASVNLPVAKEGYAAYRAWLSAAGLTQTVNNQRPQRQ